MSVFAQIPADPQFLDLGIFQNLDAVRVSIGLSFFLFSAADRRAE